MKKNSNEINKRRLSFIRIHIYVLSLNLVEIIFTDLVIVDASLHLVPMHIIHNKATHLKYVNFIACYVSYVCVFVCVRKYCFHIIASCGCVHCTLSYHFND